MRGGKGIRNSKCAPHLRDTLTRGIWKLEENAHAKDTNILLTQRPPRTQSPDAGRGADAGVMGLRE